MTRRSIRRAARHAIAGAALGLAGLAGPALAGDELIHAGRLIDGTNGPVRTNVSILVHDQRIVAVRDGFVDEAGAVVIDLSHDTVLPGLIDCHEHIISNDNDASNDAPTPHQSDMDLAVVAASNAKAVLMAGFTSIRVVGAPGGADVALKRAINRGALEGPRIWAALEEMGPTGGHSDPANGSDVEMYDPERANFIIDSPDEAVRQVRDHRRRGGDLIKIMPSGGVGSADDDPNEQLMSDAEIAAVVQTAHALGMKVAAHAHGKAAIDAAARLGVDSIEHGSFADAGSFAIMRAHGTYLVPTMLVAHSLREATAAHPHRYSPSIAAKIAEVTPQIDATVGAAYRAGVKIAFGTDTTGVSPHGDNAKEFPLLVAVGMTPKDAIFTATGAAADLLGASRDVGAVTEGHYADIIAVAGDPLADITRMEHVGFVMKGGTVYKDELGGEAARGGPARP
ncbi:MAG: amidohydrolase family protein [Caulobacteraceae bacterium]|nr:amidohydrolase family protein [Caulobacteraceae bacterium]